MKIYNISDAEDLFVLKHDIEKYLLKNNKIDKKYSVDEFINNYANVSSKIYLLNDTAIPFDLYELNGEKYLIITEEEHEKILIDKLKTINYDLSKLKQLTNSDIINNLSMNKPVNQFIINDTYYE